MYVFTLLTLTLACGHVLTGKIYGGREAKPHSRPFMVLMKITLPNKPDDYCAGFLLSKWFVMTAAHCQASSYEVYLGLHDFRHQKDVQITSVDQAFPHIDYNNENFANDVMLLKLTSQAKFSNKVQPIDLADPNDDPPEECMVFGWGRFKPNSDDLSPVLKEANVTLSNQSECEKDSFYCSMGPSGPGKGDSGCPLVCENGKVYGVMSSGKGPDENGVWSYQYSRISKTMSLIK